VSCDNDVNLSLASRAYRQPYQEICTLSHEVDAETHRRSHSFDYDRARKELRIPDEFQVEAMAAVGRPGPKESLPEKLRAREGPNDRRKVTESIFEGPFVSRPK
jgi:hypothetical protein